MLINLGTSTDQNPRGNNPVSPDQESHKPPTLAQLPTAHDATLARAKPSKPSGTAGGRQEAGEAGYEDRSPAAEVATHTNVEYLAVDIAPYRIRRDFVAWPAASRRQLGDRSSLRP